MHALSPSIFSVLYKLKLEKSLASITDRHSAFRRDLFSSFSMPPRRKPKSLKYVESSGSSDCSSGLTPARYCSLQLATALAQPADFSAACAELAILLRTFNGQQHQHGGAKKAVLELVAADISTAIANCDG